MKTWIQQIVDQFNDQSIGRKKIRVVSQGLETWVKKKTVKKADQFDVQNMG